MSAAAQESADTSRSDSSEPPLPHANETPLSKKKTRRSERNAESEADSPTTTPKMKDKSSGSTKEKDKKKVKSQDGSSPGKKKRGKGGTEYRVPDFSADFRRQHFGELDPVKLEKLRKEGVPPSRKKRSAAAKKMDADIKAYQETLRQYDKGNYFGELPDPRIKRQEKLMVWVSFGVNVALTGLKLLALILSGSLAVFASFLDSVLDLLSGSILFITERVSSRTNVYKYPIGRGRMEALAVIGFSAAMFAATGQVLVKGVEDIIDPSRIKITLDAWTVAILAVTIVSKIVLFLVCRKFEAPSVKALAADHRNDVFSNLVGLFTVLICWFIGGKYILSDPIGAIVIGIYIMYSWAERGISLVAHMSGKSATPELLSRLTYIAYKHDDRVLAVDTVRAYAVSERYFVELDLHLPKRMRLREAHDIGEALQLKLEQVPEVERAFVHLDYETEHRAEDEHYVPLKKATAASETSRTDMRGDDLV